MPTDYLEKLLAHGKAEAKAEGERQGSEKMARSIALNMLKAGYPSETILKLTRVTPQTLRKLQLSL